MQKHNSYSLANELNDEAHGENGGDDGLELEKQGEKKGQSTQEQKRDVRKFLLRMHAAENAEEIAVERRGVWDTGISEQRGKHRSESDPEDHGSGEARRARPVKLFDESANDEGRILRLLPRQHAEDACLHGKIQDGDADYGNEDAAGNIARRIADFAAEMANVVVTPVGVNGVNGCRSKSSKK